MLARTAWLLMSHVVIQGSQGCCCAEAGGTDKDPTSGKCFWPSDLGCQPWEHTRREVPCPLWLDCESTACRADPDCEAAAECAEFLHCAERTLAPLCVEGRCSGVPSHQSCDEGTDARYGCAAPVVCHGQACVIPLQTPCPASASDGG